MPRVRFRHSPFVREAHVPMLSVVECEVDQEADENVPGVCEFGISPGDEAPKQPGHKSTDSRVQ